MNDTMGDHEMALLATQIRANLARLGEFIGWPEDQQMAIDKVTETMGGLIDEIAQRNAPTFDAAPGAEDDDVVTAKRIGEMLLAAHPDRAMAIGSLMWMSRTNGLHYLKHRISRRMITFDEATGVVRGRLDTGEESEDGDAVLREADAI
jgi:hypothetical protein